MILTLRPVFNLSAPHYAVIATLPESLGGGVKVFDLLGQQELDEARKTPGDMLQHFRDAARLMPYQCNDGGLIVRFLALNNDGTTRLQNTLYAPEIDASGCGCVDALAYWLCKRARIGVLEQDHRTAPTAAQESRILAPDRVLHPAPLVA